MDSIGFYFFCLSVGYVIVWLLVNERRGNENGEWGLLAIRRPSKPDRPKDEGKNEREPGSWRL